MTWPWEVVERDHEIQNPTSREKILLLGDYLRLTSGSRVLDVACGKGGPATILAGPTGAACPASRCGPPSRTRRVVGQLRPGSRR
jgi:cyclopropane fatty-acyl-phospholipid synthase-like methyltransferase